MICISLFLCQHCTYSFHYATFQSALKLRDFKIAQRNFEIGWQFKNRRTVAKSVRNFEIFKLRNAISKLRKFTIRAEHIHICIFLFPCCAMASQMVLLINFLTLGSSTQITFPTCSILNWFSSLSTQTSLLKNGFLQATIA